MGNEHDQIHCPDLVLKIQRAMDTIESGVCKRVDVNDRIKVYACKNIIRIDIKTDGQ